MNICLVTPTTPAPAPLPAGNPVELLTISEAAVITGLSVKALARRIERGSIPAERHAGRRAVRRGELERLGLTGPGSRAARPAQIGVEVELLRDLYQRERERADTAVGEALELREQLIAIANAGPIRAVRLRRKARAQLAA